MATPRFVLLITALGAGVAIAADTAGSKPVRSKPSQFPSQIIDLFSGDARDNLASPAATSPTGAAPDTGNTATPSHGGPLPWSKLITAEALEDEIKSRKPSLAANLKTQAIFKSGTTSKKCASDLSVLAVCFAIGAEYDGPFRWKGQAVSARERFAQTGFLCSKPSDAAWDESKQREQDLDSLLRGDTLPASEAAAANNWKKITARPALMIRMEQAQQYGLAVWTANQADFKKNTDKIQHEAMLLAALAEVITRPGFEFTDDDIYLGYARTLQKSALEVLDATKNNNFEQARRAVGAATKACTSCHGGYR